MTSGSPATRLRRNALVAVALGALVALPTFAASADPGAPALAKLVDGVVKPYDPCRARVPIGVELPLDRAFPVDLAPAGPSPLLLFDYGDAPEHTPSGTPTESMQTGYSGGAGGEAHFPTRGDSYHSNQPGARHRVTTIAWLGADATLEADADSGFDEDGANNLVGNDADFDGFDDGLQPATLAPATSSLVEFSVTTYVGVTNWYVNMLVDWNFDGWWYTPANGAPEWAVQNFPINVAPMQSALFTVPVTTGTTPGTPWVRLTLSDTPIDGSLYAWMGGEWNGDTPPGTLDASGNAAFACGETEDSCGALAVASIFPRERGITCAGSG